MKFNLKFDLKQEVVQLAKIFKKNKQKFYLVGGFLRDSLLNRHTDDIDVCSFATLDVVEKILQGTNFEITNKNDEFQTANIKNGDLCFDYAMMRCDEYDKDGSHSPKKISKAKTIEEDAIRRDLTINALYLDVLKNSLIDPFCGLIDLKKKTLRAIKDDIYAEDGVRILRLLRQSATLGFKIEKKTLQNAMNNTSKLENISGSRKREELLMMLAQAKKHKIYTNSFLMRSLNKFNKHKIWQEFYLPIDKIKYNLIKKAGDDCKFLALVIDIVQTVKPRNIERFLCEFLGETGLGFSAKDLQEISNVVYGYIDVTNRLCNKDFFFKYFVYFEKIQPLIKLYSLPLYKKYTFFFNYIKNNKIAIQTSDLCIRGADIKREYPNIPQKRYGYILGELLSKVFDGQIKNDKTELLKAVGAYDY